MGMKYLDTKKDSLEEAVSKAMNGDNRPSADTLVAEGGKYLKYSDLLLQKGRLMAKNQSTAMIDKEIKKEMGKLGIKEKLDPVGKADGDIDNDGDKDDSDKYLAKRRKAISKAIANEDLEKDDEKTVKDVVKGLKKAVKTHQGQVKSLTKDIQDETNLEEGKMKELHGYIAKGMSAQQIAKKMNVDVKTIETLMKEEDLDEGKYTLPITHVIVDTRTNKVTHAASSDKSLKLDVGRKSHLKIVKLKKPTTQKKTGYLLGEPLKAWGEEVELDEKEINYDGKGPIKMSKKEYASVNKFQKSMIRGKPYVMALNTKNQSTNLVPVIFEEVDDNSMMARATRLISQTAIKEKLDPADVDMKATDLDRKAADKNIFIQLKRAQDMKGKTDVEFLDKKKQKVDIKIINKALDMFDKMKPNDKLKMQLAIGKSYRDLLKVVQRGKV